MNKKDKNKISSLKDITGEQFQEYSPSNFMRARRPKLYSDTIIVSEPHLTKEVFEYHLETLTNRKQEYEFEHFCRKLAEKEICPNLLPQTGPTGGGDSKVDSETYPIADDISIRWYNGIGREASQERWAFAFSAKKDWIGKVRTDVEKIVQTKRGYKKIFFITNQFVRDKSRAEIEDELRESFNIDVRVFDRTWIVKCIFENKRILLAVETLNISDSNIKTETITGPRDYKRNEELKKLEEDINDIEKYSGVEYQLAEDCLKAALIARGLELPRTEVEGRFHRAVRIAEKVDYPSQRLRIFYNNAWTQYWWYDDYNELNRLYSEVEKLALNSVHSFELELLTNLWQCLYSSVICKKLKQDNANIKSRTKRLKTKLYSLSSDKNRPNNALYAQSLRLIIDFNDLLSKHKPIDSIFEQFREILSKRAGFSEYPVRRDICLIEKMGEIITDNQKFDELFDTAVDILSKRASEGEAGIALLKRGIQKLDANKSYDAIKLLGQAIPKLAKDEYNNECISALAGCSFAYEKIGLLWASRANIIYALNILFLNIIKQGERDPRILFYVQRLVWLEIQLGRVPIAIAWIELAFIILQQIKLNDKRKNLFLKELESQDFVLGLLLLKTDFYELKWLKFLPDILDKYNFIKSWFTLLYIFGHEKYLRDNEFISEDENSNTVQDCFVKLLNHPANNDLPEKPEFLFQEKINFSSNVLGCNVCVDLENNPISIDLGETILGALESLLATCLDSRIFPHRADIKIIIKLSDFHHGVPKFVVDDSVGGRIIHVVHERDYKRNTKDHQNDFQEWLWGFIANVFSQIAIIVDFEEFEKHVIGDESSLGRALNFSDVSVVIKNIMGQNPKFSLSDWKSESGKECFELLRDFPWNHGLEIDSDKDVKEQFEWKVGKGEPPEGLFDIDSLKHKDRKVFSLINISLWDKAKWQATGYVIYPNIAPFLVLAFNNIIPAKQIFKEWLESLSNDDKEERLRVSIITGIDKSYPSNYRVLISENPKIKPASQFVLTARMQTMNPPSQYNLNLFLEGFKKFGEYILIPAHIDSLKQMEEPLRDLGIRKRKLRVCPAWKIGENDQDVVLIHEEDDPIIPDDVQDAPVIHALNRFKNRKF